MHVSLKVGDKAVYPAHGVGEVMAIEERHISGQEQAFYILRILENGMKIMIPASNVGNVGLREVIAKDKVGKVFDILKARAPTNASGPWSRRHREHVEKIKTGSLYEVAEVLRDLYSSKKGKELSFGERKLADTAKRLLVKELAVAKGCHEDEIETELKQIFQA